MIDDYLTFPFFFPFFHSSSVQAAASSSNLSEAHTAGAGATAGQAAPGPTVGAGAGAWAAVSAGLGPEALAGVAASGAEALVGRAFDELKACRALLRAS